MADTFRTLKGYDLCTNTLITKTMEDYLEMIYRIYCREKYIRISSLASELNVKPSSSSKMVYELRQRGLVDYEKYGVIRLTEKGFSLGSYLLNRHNILHAFFCRINKTTDELRQTEEVEHFINKKTLSNIEKLLEYLNRQGY
jgi:Mn-dependent DtxR family transcriptional regulator